MLSNILSTGETSEALNSKPILFTQRFRRVGGEKQKNYILGLNFKDENVHFLGWVRSKTGWAVTSFLWGS